MTPLEFSLEFDIKYNNIKSQAAPGLDDYEKSVFLTDSLEELVLDVYEGRNDKLETFEETEIKRRYLDKLIKQQTLITTTSIPSDQHIQSNSVFYELPSDLMLITNEQLKLSSSNNCYNTKIIDVVPIRQDEYLVHKKNPFRNPSMKGRTNHAWRLDYGNHTSRLIEIIVPADVLATGYIVRYIKKPAPIILSNLTSLGLTINGIAVQTPCELDSIIHREIVDRAVRKADIAYKFNGVQPQQQ